MKTKIILMIAVFFAVAKVQSQTVEDLNSQMSSYLSDIKMRAKCKIHQTFEIPVTELHYVDSALLRQIMNENEEIRQRPDSMAQRLKIEHDIAMAEILDSLKQGVRIYRLISNIEEIPVESATINMGFTQPVVEYWEGYLPDSAGTEIIDFTRYEDGFKEMSFNYHLKAKPGYEVQIGCSIKKNGKIEALGFMEITEDRKKGTIFSYEKGSLFKKRKVISQAWLFNVERSPENAIELSEFIQKMKFIFEQRLLAQN